MKTKQRSKFMGNNQYQGKTDEDRFWEKVDKRSDDECWEWMASCHHEWKYGSFSVNTKYVAAHRFSWVLHNGEIPEGMLVCHHCDNPPCVNPNHLFLGTDFDNMQDMVKKGRADNVGERNGRSVLTEEDVKQIFRLYKSGNYTHRQLGDMFGVKPITIGATLKRRIWSHVEIKGC